MKKFLSLLALIIIGAASYAQNGAKIQFRSDTVDYGTVSAGDSGKRTFEFTNTGDAPLTITDVKSTQGISVDWPKEPVLPGKTGKIEIKYNMNPGPIRKTVTVQTNAVNYPNGVVALKVKGTVTGKK